MRRFLVLIGALSLTLGVSTTLCPDRAMAASSTNYQLASDNQDQATVKTGVSASYTIKQSDVTWKATNLTSTSYQLVDPGFDGSVASSASSSAGGGTSGGTSGGAGGGTHIPHGGGRPHTSSSSASSISSVSSSAPYKEETRGAASSSASSVSSDIFHKAPESTTASRGTEASLSLGEIQFFNVIDPLCTTTVISPENSAYFDWVPVILSFLLSFGWFAYTPCRCRKTKRTKNTGSQKKKIAMLLLLAFVLGMTSIESEKAYAVQTTPSKHMYNGRLLTASGTPVTTAQSIRFSYWTSTDFVTGDTDGSGNINTGATTYANWNEVHTVTPNSNGYFSVEMGSVTTLPDLATLPIATLLSLYLQVEVKPQASANTAYELLDIDPTDTAIDRSGVLSVPLAKNADTIDQREIGTSSGSIAILGTGGTFPVSTVPGGTNAGVFTIDANDTEVSEISLQFGTALNKKLTYDIVNNVFRFNSNVQIQGNLTISGTINGVNITQLQSATGALKASSGGGLNLNVSYGNYRLNGIVTNYVGGTIALYPNATNYVFFGSGGLTKNTTGFPADESVIRVSQVTTTAGSISSVLDSRVLSSDDREKNRTTVFTPSFEKATYQGDGGSDNVGQLSTTHDNTNLQNFYLWTSSKATMQDYDILVRIPISENFVRWQNSATVNPISFSYRSTGASSALNKLDMQIYDSAGTPVTLSGATTNLASTTWATAQVEFTGTPTWTAGQDLLIRIKMSAKDNYQMHMGSLKLNTVIFE